MPTTRVLSSGVGELQLVVAEHVAVDVAVQVGVDGAVDGEGGVLGGERCAVGEGDAVAELEGPLVGRGLAPLGGQQRLEVAGVGVALDERLGDVGADDDAGGGQRALARLERRRLLGQHDAQGVGVVAAVAGVGDGAAGGGDGDSREGDGQGLASRVAWCVGSWILRAAGVTSTYVDDACDRRHTVRTVFRQRQPQPNGEIGRFWDARSEYQRASETTSELAPSCVSAAPRYPATRWQSASDAVWI